MNKDAVLASVIGFGIGLVITGGIILGPDLFTKLKATVSQWSVAQSTNDTTDSTDTTDQPGDHHFMVNAPENESIVDSKTVTITGTALPESTIVISSPVEETVVQVQDDGTFTGDVSVQDGNTGLSVVNITSDKQEVKTLTVYYEPS